MSVPGSAALSATSLVARTSRSGRPRLSARRIGARSSPAAAEQVEIEGAPVVQMKRQSGTAGEIEIAGAEDRFQSIESVALLFRQSGGLAHGSFSAWKNARQKPSVRSLSSGWPTSRKKQWMRANPYVEMSHRIPFSGRRIEHAGEDSNRRAPPNRWSRSRPPKRGGAAARVEPSRSDDHRRCASGAGARCRKRPGLVPARSRRLMAPREQSTASNSERL